MTTVDEDESEGDDTDVCVVVPDLIYVDDYRHKTRPPSAKLSRWATRRLSRVTAICVHQTAVPGGFGVVDYQIAKAKKDDPDSLLPDEVQGLLWRYRKTAYHAVYNPKHRVAVVQWHPRYRTNHGNGANSYSVGWAYDGHFTSHYSDALDVDGGRFALKHLVEVMREVGCPLKYVEAHRQHSDDRAADPGCEIWSEIVTPVARDMGLELREDHTTRDGLPIPEDWHG